GRLRPRRATHRPGDPRPSRLSRSRPARVVYPKTLRQAFAQLKPNGDLRPLYDAAVARQQADQIFNLSLTRTATKTLLGPGARGVIGIGRVKTPTLGIVCLREL